MALDNAASSEAVLNFLALHPLLGIGVMLLLGYLLGRIAGAVGLPDITGFIVAGLIMGGDVLGVLGENAADELAIITEIALGLIAFTIGSELRAPKLRRMGRKVAATTAGQVLLTFALVSAVLSFTSVPWQIAILLGTIACTTSPAAIVAVVHSTRGRGRFVDHLLSCVALGDAAAIALFGVALALAPALLGSAVRIPAVLSQVVSDLSVSLVMGVLAGFLVFTTTRRQSSTGETLILTLGFVFLSTSIAMAAGLSPLLTNMVAGATLANLSSANARVFRSLEPLAPPIYALFFVLAGTKLSPSILLSAETLTLGGLFVAARAAGKYIGASTGAVLSGSEPAVRRWLGAGLFAHAAVALGLVLLVQGSTELAAIDVLPDGILVTAVNIVLLSVFVNEIVGPLIAQIAVRRALRLED